MAGMGRLAIDEIGNHYGKLVVIERAANKGGHAAWLCKCDCGKETEVCGVDLRNGHTQSCGCLQKERAGEANFIDEAGNQYGNLTVLRQAETTENGQARWFCHCICGKDVEVLGRNLRGRHTKSCGCLRRGRMSLPAGGAAFNALIRTMKESARRRGYSWDLTNEQVRQLTSQSCFYCGEEPSQQGTSRSNRNGIYLYNGLDRVDNKQGYIIDNVIPSCGRCNKAKQTMTTEEFKAWVCRIYAHFGRKP